MNSLYHKNGYFATKQHVSFCQDHIIKCKFCLSIQKNLPMALHFTQIYAIISTSLALLWRENEKTDRKNKSNSAEQDQKDHHCGGGRRFMPCYCSFDCACKHCKKSA